jgi:hypothetical protein
VKPAALGWLPDPTGRYEYRYWDGSDWCPDVFDDGLMFRDPFSLGSLPPPRRRSSRRWAPRLIGSGVLAAGVAASVAFAIVPVTGGGTETAGDSPRDSSTTTRPSSSSSTSQVAGSSSTTAATTPAGPGLAGPGSSSTTATSAPAGGGGGGGNDADTQDIVDSIAQGLVASGMGMMPPDQAECFAQGLVDGLGVDRIRELGMESGDIMAMNTAMTSLTPEEQMALSNAMTACGPPSAPPA